MSHQPTNNGSSQVFRNGCPLPRAHHPTSAAASPHTRDNLCAIEGTPSRGGGAGGQEKVRTAMQCAHARGAPVSFWRRSRVLRLLQETFLDEVIMIVQALIINAFLILAIPRVISRPIGVKFIDEFVTYLRAQQTFLVSSSLLLAIVLYGTQYWLDHSDASAMDGPTSPTKSFEKA